MQKLAQIMQQMMDLSIQSLCNW